MDEDYEGIGESLGSYSVMDRPVGSSMLKFLVGIVPIIIVGFVIFSMFGIVQEEFLNAGVSNVTTTIGLGLSDASQTLINLTLIFFAVAVVFVVLSIMFQSIRGFGSAFSDEEDEEESSPTNKKFIKIKKSKGKYDI